MGKIILTYCDNCGTRGAAARTSATNARRKNQDRGWHNKGKLDVCDECHERIGRHVPPDARKRSEEQWIAWVRPA